MLHNCTYCDYKTTVKSNLRRHMRNKHGESLISNDNSVPNTVSGNNQSNVAPTTQYGMEPTSHYESISAEIYPCEDTPKVSTAVDVDMQHGLGIDGAQDNQTVSIQGYKNIVEETYKWQDAYEGQKQGNIMKDNAIKIRDMHLLKSNNKLLSEITRNRDNNEKISAMGKDMGKLIHKYEI